MSEVVNFSGYVKIAPDSSGSAGAYAALNGVSSFRLERSGDELEKSYYGAGRQRKFKSGMSKVTASAQLNYIVGDTAQGTVLDAMISGDQVWVKYAPNNNTGEVEYAFPAIITSQSQGGNVDALNDIPLAFTVVGTITEGTVA